jgi:8-oxo-dGTP pyrophosphatase MutT (NUDIX family)
VLPAVRGSCGESGKDHAPRPKYALDNPSWNTAAWRSRSGPLALPPMDDSPPSRWRRHARSIVYENPWLTVWHDEVTRPDGEPGIYGVIHYANLAVGIVAIDAQDRVALVGQHRYTLDAYSWEIPEGGVPPDEDPQTGAARELREETGIIAGQWREISRLHLSNSVSDEVAVHFLATDLTPGPPSPDGTEDLAVRWVPFDEALAMALDGRITDAMSVAALLQVGLTRMRAGSNSSGTTISPTRGAQAQGRRNKS